MSKEPLYGIAPDGSSDPIKTDGQGKILLTAGGPGVGGVISTSVNSYADLPDPNTVPGELYFVVNSTGTWLVNRKGSGFYHAVAGSWVEIGDFGNLDQDLIDSLNSIQTTPGPQGPQGIQGIQGVKGDTGSPGSDTWGSITGTLSDQTDLVAALDTKQPSLTTLTNHYILVGNGSGNVTLVSPSTAGFVLTSNGASLDPSFQSFTSGSGVNVHLSNLSSTAVNSDIIPGSDGSLSLGSSTYYWNTLFSKYIELGAGSQMIFTDSSGTKTCTIESPTGFAAANYTLYLPLAQASGTKLLQNDGSGNLSWVSPTANTLAWGNMTGTLSDQTDLQSALNLKAPASAPSFSTSVTLSYASSSTVPYLDIDKKLISSSVTPTELGYVHGVTSAIQTQLNAKQAALTEGNLTEATSSILTITGGTSAVIGSGTTIQVTLADTTHSGYLSSTDWTTFNGKSTYFDPLTTKGDILYESATPAAARLAIGTEGQVLTVASGIPSWAAASAGSGGPVYTLNLTNQNAQISATALYTTPNDSTIHLYRVSTAGCVTTATSGSSNNINIQVGFTDPHGTALTPFATTGVSGVGTVTQLMAGGSVTGSGVWGGDWVFLANPNTAIQYATSNKADSNGTSKYSLSFSVEKLI